MRLHLSNANRDPRALKGKTLSLRMALWLGVMSAALPLSLCAQPASSTADVTRLRVTDQVILAHVTRLGINLGEQNFFDSGQMLKNLLARNPEFAGMTYRGIFHCSAGRAGLCVDMRPGIRFPANFWNGADYEVLDGAAMERSGTVSAAAPGAGGFALTLSGTVSAGDWIAVETTVKDDAGAGWWPTLRGGARLAIERNDLPPGAPVRQALEIDAAGVGRSAELNAYFDSIAGMSFVHLRGRYRLQFRAKAISGSGLMHVHVARLVPGLRRYLDQDVHLTRNWTQYSEEFTANERSLPAAAVETGFSFTDGAALLSDVSLERVDADPANRTAFRDEVVATLKELHPGVLRLMESEAGLGSAVENLLAAPAARQRSGYRADFKPSDDVAIGIPEFLELCREVNAEPWIVAPAAMSLSETRLLAEYLAGPATSRGGALRASAGRREPWTQAFPTIHIELGNETWNPDFRGESIEDPTAYGQRANAVFGAFREAAGPEADRFDLVAGAHVYDPGRNPALLAAAPLATSLAIAPYLMRSLTQWADNNELYGPLLAQPEQMSREGVVAQAAQSAGGRQLAVYEVNLHTTGGSAPQPVLDRFTPSAAAGVAVAGHMLRMMRDHGIRDEMLYSLPQYQFMRADGTPVKLWGSVVEMGGRKRPQFLAVSLANRAIRGDLVKVEIEGENPTRDVPPGNDGVRLRKMHEIDAYAFQDGTWHGLVVFNYGLDRTRRVEVEAAGLARGVRATLWRLRSSSPGDTNEQTVQVKIVEDRADSGGFTLAPCSMAVLEWSQ